ncbi:MAG TPA: hypothetical protein VMV69_26710 [Pirellulales bacterium]|nr:hypothetical protein [Pirellulales bacterium]
MKEVHAPGAAASLHLDGNRRVYQPGDTLAGEYHVEGLKPDEPCKVELSVVWYTEGLGDEDMAVHFFERFNTAERPQIDLRAPQRFSTVLPPSPLSYLGFIVKIHWCARLRLYLPRGKELFCEVTFQLGSVPAARSPTPTRTKETAPDAGAGHERGERRKEKGESGHDRGERRKEKGESGHDRGER